ncbi:MAG: hypothetical protein WAL22_05375 [Solirubrobacteraceae bacterium]
MREERVTGENLMLVGRQLAEHLAADQVTPSSELCSACWISGNAGITAELSIAYARPPIERTARITVVWIR